MHDNVRTKEDCDHIMPCSGDLDLVRLHTILLHKLVEQCTSGRLCAELHADEMGRWSMGRRLLLRKQKLLCVQKINRQIANLDIEKHQYFYLK